MSERIFSAFAANENNPHYQRLITRQAPIYERENEIRSPFYRDYTRILHSMAFRRLKHKTQVFFNIDNDHICTRMEHVSHVESVSATIAKALGLNEELTKAISMGHDLGHAPFGHQGEVVIRELSNQYLGQSFWHEQNGLRFVDQIELLEDTQKINQNLNLTYAVRDGIISHCGEVDQNGIFPRDISIDISLFTSPGLYQAVTWEGCVVKMADKIAYVGRDIEDAIALGILDGNAQNELKKMASLYDRDTINTTVIMRNMIVDICSHSTPDNGILLSPALNKQLKEIKDFNYSHIYNHPRLSPYRHYSELVIHQLFEFLLRLYDDGELWNNLSENTKFAPNLISSFRSWLIKYCDPQILPESAKETVAFYANKKIYGTLNTKQIYIQAIIDFIAGMTDRFAITLFQELLQFGYHSY